MRHPELLVPASSLEVLKIAVIFGADAVYIGGEAFGLRAKAKNFSMEDMKEGILFAHAHDVKVYVTANILAHNEDLEGVRAYFEELKEIWTGWRLSFQIRACLRLRGKSVLKLIYMSVRRRTTPITALFYSGRNLAQAEL